MKRSELRAVVRKAMLATVPRRPEDEVPQESHIVVPGALIHECEHGKSCCAHTVFAVGRFAGTKRGKPLYDELCAVVLADSAGADDDVDLKELAEECSDFADTLAELFAVLPEVHKLLKEEPQEP